MIGLGFATAGSRTRGIAGGWQVGHLVDRETRHLLSEFVDHKHDSRRETGRAAQVERETSSISHRGLDIAIVPPVVFLEPNMMGGVLVYGFAAAVLGGLTSPLGAVVGGFLVGVFENLAGTYIPGVGNELKLPIALALIITVLVFKPAGLFGRAIVKRV